MWRSWFTRERLEPLMRKIPCIGPYLIRLDLFSRANNLSWAIYLGFCCIRMVFFGWRIGVRWWWQGTGRVFIRDYFCYPDFIYSTLWLLLFLVAFGVLMWTLPPFSVRGIDALVMSLPY